jgi:hypothetical protein
MSGKDAQRIDNGAQVRRGPNWRGIAGRQWILPGTISGTSKRREIQALLRLETASVFSERTAPSDSAALLASGGTGPCPFGGLIHGKNVNHKDETHRKIASAAFLP